MVFEIFRQMVRKDACFSSAELGKSVSREFGAVIRESKDQGENEGCKQMKLLDLK